MLFQTHVILDKKTSWQPSRFWYTSHKSWVKGTWNLSQISKHQGHSPTEGPVGLWWHPGSDLTKYTRTHIQPSRNLTLNNMSTKHSKLNPTGKFLSWKQCFWFSWNFTSWQQKKIGWKQLMCSTQQSIRIYHCSLQSSFQLWAYKVEDWIDIIVTM